MSSSPHGSVLLSPIPLHSAFGPRLVVIRLPGHALASCLPLPSPGTLHLLFWLLDGASEGAQGTIMPWGLWWSKAFSGSPEPMQRNPHPCTCPARGLATSGSACSPPGPRHDPGRVPFSPRSLSLASSSRPSCPLISRAATPQLPSRPVIPEVPSAPHPDPFPQTLWRCVCLGRGRHGAGGWGGGWGPAVSLEELGLGSSWLWRAGVSDHSPL